MGEPDETSGWELFEAYEQTLSRTSESIVTTGHRSPRILTSARKHCCGNHSEVGQYQQATREELPPLLFAGVQLSKRGHAGGDENNMSDASDEHHERVGSVCVAGTKKSPKLMRSGLY
jgi:hypothetical protein